MPRKTPCSLSVMLPSIIRFNEAAARCRGKLHQRSTGSSAKSGFNEAAARCRGKLAHPRGIDPGWDQLQ